MFRKNHDMGSAHLASHRVDSLYEVFHENTKLNPANEAMLGLRIGNLLRNPSVVAMLSKGYSRFPHLPRVELPQCVTPTNCSLDEALRRRRSIREFTEEPLTLMQLAQMLVLSYGLSGGYEFGDGQVQYVRPAPSGGGLYPVELYVIAQRVADLEPGVYHYNVPDHVLERIPDRADMATSIETLSHYKGTLTGAAALIVLTAVFARNTYKYGDRGYRFVLLDAGHVAQNLLLVAAAANLGAVPIGGYRDDQLSHLVGADGINEAALYLLAVGHPSEQATEIALRQRKFVEEGGSRA